MSTETDTPPIVLVGAGANGSAILPLIARMPGVAQLAVIDSQTYSAGNLAGQAIVPADVGRRKVDVQRERAAVINPGLEIRSFNGLLEAVPLGWLRDAIVVCATDNRGSRVIANRMVGRVGRGLVDTAVDAPSLVRVASFHCGPDTPCLECNKDPLFYELSAQEYPCAGASVSVAPTGASAELAALAASLGAVALRKLCGPDGAGAAGSQLMLDIGSYRQHYGRFRRNPDCRFDHRDWQVARMPVALAECTLADLFSALAGDREASIALEGHRFVEQLHCAGCGARRALGLRLALRISADQQVCCCGGRLMVSGYSSREALSRADLTTADLDRPLAALGLLAGDVISVTVGTDPNGETSHMELVEAGL